MPGMPSKAAHRAALRRSKEPGVIAPAELSDLPLLPPDHGWRNPMREYDYVRDEWELYRMGVHASITLAVIHLLDAGSFSVHLASADFGPADLVGTAQEAFMRAAGHAQESDFS
jgi:hypothetical protein